MKSKKIVYILLIVITLSSLFATSAKAQFIDSLEFKKYPQPVLGKPEDSIKTFVPKPKSSTVWLSPSEKIVSVKKFDFDLKFAIRAEYPLVSVQIFSNSNALNINFAGINLGKTGNLNFETNLKLVNDSNRLVIKVITSSDTTISEQRIVYKIPNRRLALIIGNADYTNGTLANPVNDARDMAAVLQTLDFDVIEHLNLPNRNEVENAVVNFGSRLPNYDVGLFFYAGHGIQVDGANYIIPTRIQLNSKKVIKTYCFDINTVLAEMEGAGSKVNIVIVDACRDNPFERSWSRSESSSGLATMNAPDGTFIAYATSPGKVASDGAGKNGLYTAELIKQLQVPNLSLEDVFKRVGANVKALTNKDQTPWVSSSFTGEFFFMKK